MLTTIANHTPEKSNLSILSTVLDDSGKEVATQKQSVKANANSKTEVKTNFKVISQKLWDIETPNLYKLVTKVFQGKDLKDTYTTTFSWHSLS